jgi:uncharacterized cofD-like protein
MKFQRPKKNKKIVVIGGGTGSFTVLSSLKAYTSKLTAIVSMADDGGSTGVLRDELGTLPPGDVRQCLVALSNSPKLRDLFEYRFDTGTFSGHSFGNIFLTALEKVDGNFAEAVETASEVLNVRGTVLPATLDNVRLQMKWKDYSVELHGERVIDAENFDHDPREAMLNLEPQARPNPAALAAIKQADLVVIAPGDLYTSLGPLLVIEGIAEALVRTNAKVLYVCNLVTKHGQTDGFDVVDHASELERFAGRPFIDTVLCNVTPPAGELLERYKEEEAYIVKLGEAGQQHYRLVTADLLGGMAVADPANTLPVVHSLIRHDYSKLGSSIMEQV